MGVATQMILRVSLSRAGIRSDKSFVMWASTTSEGTEEVPDSRAKATRESVQVRLTGESQSGRHAVATVTEVESTDSGFRRQGKSWGSAYFLSAKVLSRRKPAPQLSPPTSEHSFLPSYKLMAVYLRSPKG